MCICIHLIYVSAKNEKCRKLPFRVPRVNTFTVWGPVLSVIMASEKKN